MNLIKRNVFIFQNSRHNLSTFFRHHITIVQHFKLEDGAVLIEPDVREYFHDSEAVNNALRCLIPLLSKKYRRKAKHNL
jgi:hypothetical protein